MRVASPPTAWSPASFESEEKWSVPKITQTPDRSQKPVRCHDFCYAGMISTPRRKMRSVFTALLGTITFFATTYGFS